MTSANNGAEINVDGRLLGKCTMQLKVKTLKNDEETVEIDPSATVEELMQKVNEAFPSMPVDRQKLIHAGKILKPELSLKDYGDIKDGDKVIVLAARATSAASQSVHAQTDVSEQASSNQQQQGADDASQSGAVQPSTSSGNGTLPCSTNPSDTSQQVTAPSSVVDPLQNSENVQRLCDMGFARVDVERALAAAFYNPERAVEFLSTGHIPEVEPIQVGQSYDNTASTRIDNFSQLTSHPMFEQLRQVVQSDPQMLQQILENLAQSNPELLQSIIERQDEFMDLINAPSVPLEGFSSADAPNIVQLTEQEMASVERLEGLGFPRPAVIEAFLACDKNEQLAANYLLENANDMLEHE